MRAIVVYNSKTGFTRKYAEWIAQELGCKAMSVKQANYSDCDVVLYGGWIMANKIAGLDKFKSNQAIKAKKLIVYATGLTEMSDAEEIEKIKNANLSASEQKEIPFYYLAGGINYEKMGFLSKSMLKMLYQSLAKKQDRTEKETNMMKSLESSVDHSDRVNIKPLIDYVKGI
jgi:menaquinone-dependent protoporphyrinogen IX oxidase